MNDFIKNRAALITGSTQGIGFGIAKAFAKEGCKITLNGLASTEQVKTCMDSLLNSGATEVHFLGHDLSDSTQALNLVPDARKKMGTVDILINNAGVQHTASLEEMPVEIWQKIINLNLSSAFYTMKQALPEMAKQGYGRVINISSVHGLVASVNKSPYVSAKFGLVGLSKVAALEYAKSGTAKSGGVTVNCICPGWVETDLIENQIIERAKKHHNDRNKGIVDLLQEKQPSLRMTQTDEIGDLAVWLAHRAAHNITGIALPVDGGWTAQ